jgi:acyl-CoA thioester hydrolase
MEHSVKAQLRWRDMDMLGHLNQSVYHELLDGEVEVVVRLAHVGTSSLRLELEVRLPDGTIAASGMTVLAAWDAASRQKLALTEAELAALS